jgi:hypothetical protein
MRNRILILICTLFFALACCALRTRESTTPAQETQAKKQSPPPGSAPKPFKVPKQEKFSLPNGLEATLVPYGSIPKVMIAVSVRAGNLNEAANQVWLADLTTSLKKSRNKQLQWEARLM